MLAADVVKGFMPLLDVQQKLEIVKSCFKIVPGNLTKYNFNFGEGLKLELSE